MTGLLRRGAEHGRRLAVTTTIKQHAVTIITDIIINIIIINIIVSIISIIIINATSTVIVRIETVIKLIISRLAAAHVTVGLGGLDEGGACASSLLSLSLSVLSLLSVVVVVVVVAVVVAVVVLLSLL